MNNLNEPSENKSPHTKPIWVTPKEAIRISGIKRTRLYELLGQGAIQSIKVGGKRLVSYGSIESLGDRP